MEALKDLLRNDIKPLPQRLQEANEGLSKLNLSYEKLPEDYRKEKMQAEKLAQELWEASARDHLTGLYNRRYPFDFLDKEVNRVVVAAGESGL